MVILLGGLVLLVAGAWLFFEVFLVFRARVNRSLNLVLDVIKVSQSRKNDQQSQEARQSGEKEEISKMEHFLASISNLPAPQNFFHKILYGQPQLTFELSVASDSDLITFYVAIPSRFREMVEKQIHSFYPSAFIEEVEDYNIFQPQSCTAGSWLKLKKNPAFPLLTYQRLESDPLGNITNALSKLSDPQEGASIQLVMRSCKAEGIRKKARKIAQEMQQGKRLDKASGGANPLAGMGGELASAAFGTGKDPNDPTGQQKDIFSLTPEEQDVIKQLEVKANKYHFEANVRLLASAATPERATMILEELENAFVQFGDSNLNSLKPVRSKKRNAHNLAGDFIFRSFNKSQAIVLDAEELASLYHLPISSTSTPKVDWLRAKSAPPPSKIPTEGVLLGYSDFRGSKVDIRMDVNDRRRHLYIIGQTGVGKSNLIEEQAKQDAAAGNGFCIIDPHGEAVEHVLECIPKERADDVICFDPADIERPMAFNMMEYDAARPEQKTFVINEMIAIFDKLYDLKSTGGPMFEQYMRNAMLLVMDSPEIGSTLMEVPRIFRDVEFRRKKISLCKDYNVIDFWEKEAEKAGGDASLENIAPYINSKLTTFISNDIMRPIISQQESSINFREVMDEKKILLVSLSKGKIGDINSNLLGMVIVGKLLMAALSRTEIPEDQRNDFYLYIDEFQNVTTDSISVILSEARKYRLALTIGHQFIGQLSEGISKAVFGNVGSMCSFRVGSEDAEFLQKQFSPTFEADDLINVDNFNCFAKLLLNNETSAPFNMKTYPPKSGNPKLAEAYKELSRYKYGRDRTVVEREIKERNFA